MAATSRTTSGKLRGDNLPLRVCLWDGWSLDLGLAPKVVLRVNKPAGLRDLVRLRLDVLGRAYVEGELITSIGMFEHVGLKNLRSYFAKIRALLSDDGVVMNHGITSADPDSTPPSRRDSFIARYVFPHGELPHIGADRLHFSGPRNLMS